MVKNIIYYKDGWGVFTASPQQIQSSYEPKLNKFNEFIVKGNMLSVQRFNEYKLVAKEVVDPKYGLQYEVIFISENYELDDKEQQKLFLENILTTKQLKNIYDTLDDPFETIKNEDVEQLTKVKGIGVTTALKIIEKYKNTIDYSSIYIQLDRLGLSNNMITKLCRRYKSPELFIKKFQENPYILFEDVDGIGFKKADQLALRYGVDKSSPFRIRAFIKYYLTQEANKGNSYVSTKQLVKTLLEFLGSDLNKKNIGKTLLDTSYLWMSEDKQYVGLKKYYELEQCIAYEITRLLKCRNKFKYDNWELIISNLEQKQGFKFTKEQRDGIKAVLDNQVVVITGYSGTGKSTIVKGMLEVLKGYRFAQTALSGRAASRMFEITGEEGKTIHKLLGYNPQLGYTFNKINKLPYDIVILDETSMVGADLFYKLIQAIKNESKLIMLGDDQQLASIGCGNILYDLINCNVVPVVKLTKIHRQAQKSAIKTESIKIRNKHQIIDKGYTGRKILGELKDLELDIYKDKSQTLPKIIEHFKSNIDRVPSILDLQIIAPLNYKGDACNFKINKVIQKIYNPYPTNKIKISLSKDKKYMLSEGDKVINTRNNYNTVDIHGKITPIYNGNLGIIEKINKQAEMMVINFENIGRVIVEKMHWRYINLGYSISIHKCQGSEFDIVIVGIDYASYVLLSNELLYTAITRAKKYCVLCAETNALRFATNKSNVSKKQTFLQSALKNRIK